MPDVPFTAPVPDESGLQPGVVVAGYRLLRQVADAVGFRSWLARAPGDEETVCLTVQRTTEALNRRIDAHSRISSPHVLALIDLATDAGGHIILAYERTDWTLATLLSSRVRLAPGEAVTVLAPLVTGLAAIHRAGLCHGGVTPAAVLFCPDGRPVLGGLDALRDAWEENPYDDRMPPGVLADYRAFGNLIAAVADVVDETARPGFFGISDWIETQLRDSSASGSFLGQMECRIFALAPALPVVLAPDRQTAGVSGRGPTGALRAAARSATAPGGATAVLPALARAASAVGRSGLGAWIQRVSRGRALALCLGIVLLVVTLLLGLAAIPDRMPVPAGSFPDGIPSSQPVRPVPAAEPPASAGQAESAPRIEGEDKDMGEAVTAEDPVAATLALFRLRSRCADEGSTECVSRYAEPRSALAEADKHAFGKTRPSVRLLDGADHEVQLVQAYGDVVLVRASPANDRRQPVFILAVRTDTGWRLRDLFEPD
ncbi:hypothetical protein [Mycetocola sp.]|uniref:hypothetical protein n=1 Tax=Mycetocola sp. TaxID=1871042 RepID=UPI00398A1E9E